MLQPEKKTFRLKLGYRFSDSESDNNAYIFQDLTSRNNGLQNLLKIFRSTLEPTLTNGFSSRGHGWSERKLRGELEVRSVLIIFLSADP